MIVKGLMKTSLIDFPGNIAAVIFTAGCNMRCPFCHNAKLVLNSKELKKYNEEEIFSFLKTRKHLIDGVCITGGEPTLYKDLPDYIRKIRAMGLKVKLDSNGTNPQMLKYLFDEKLIEYIAMDIKHTPDKYIVAAGADTPMTKIKESIKLIRESGVDYEFRTTILPEIHSKKDIIEIGKWLSGCMQYSIQNFVPNEDMFNPNLSKRFTEVEMVALKQELENYIDRVEIK